MRMITIHLTDGQLLTLAKIALAPGGTVGSFTNALDAAGIDTHDTVWLADHGYIQDVERHAPGGPLPHLQVTTKGHRELMIRFIA